MAGALVALSALTINAVVFLFVRPTSVRNAFLLGTVALPLAVLTGIGIKITGE